MQWVKSAEVILTLLTGNEGSVCFKRTWILPLIPECGFGVLVCAPQQVRERLGLVQEAEVDRDGIITGVLGWPDDCLCRRLGGCAWQCETGVSDSRCCLRLKS